MPGSLPFSPIESTGLDEDASETYAVHGGMLRMARVMGEEGKPVHTAVRDALRKNPRYGKHICMLDCAHLR